MASRSGSDEASDQPQQLSAEDFVADKLIANILGLSQDHNLDGPAIQAQDEPIFKFPDLSSGPPPSSTNPRLARESAFLEGFEAGDGFQELRRSRGRAHFESPDGPNAAGFGPGRGFNDNHFRRGLSQLPLLQRRHLASFLPTSMQDLSLGAAVPKAQQLNDSPESDIGYGTSFDSGNGRRQRMTECAAGNGISELLRNFEATFAPSKPPAMTMSPFGSLTTLVRSRPRGEDFGSHQALGDVEFSRDPTSLEPPPVLRRSASYQQLPSTLLQQQQEQLMLRNLHQSCYDLRMQAFPKIADWLSAPQNQFRPSGGAVTNNDFQTRAGAAGEVKPAATCVWTGPLSSSSDVNSPMSSKVFLGGVPWDVTEDILATAFLPFGNIRVEWPSNSCTAAFKGYVYVIFEREDQVRCLLSACDPDMSDVKSWHYILSSRRKKNKPIQIVPWFIEDARYPLAPTSQPDCKLTIYVGALHGQLTAEGLFTVFNDLFGGVISASLATDRYKYPIGSGRVSFNNTKSYMAAVAAEFVLIRTNKFTKKIQVDPYLDDVLCDLCRLRHGPYFCRSLTCFKYFCRSCWDEQHSLLGAMDHKPLMR